MQLSEAERLALELLQERDEQARRESEHRMLRLMTSVAERTGIPLTMLGVNRKTGELSDARMTAPTPINGAIDEVPTAGDPSD